jgi:hypothetical protein
MRDTQTFKKGTQEQLVYEQAATMGCSKYSTQQPEYLRASKKSDSEMFHEDLSALKSEAEKLPDGSDEKSKLQKQIVYIETVFLDALKKDLLEYAAHFKKDFNHIKVQIEKSPLSDENKKDIQAYFKYCEANSELYKKIKIESSMLSDMSNKAHADKDAVLQTFCDSKIKMLDTVKENLKDPTKAIPPIPPASWVEKAYKEAKSDLGYSKDMKVKQALLNKKLDVLLADAAVNKAENPALTKLNALQAKLQYQELLYTVRSGTSKEYYGFFKFGHSASDKLKETNAMLQEVTRLKDKPDTASEWTAGDAAKQGALKDLYKELKSLGGIEKPPTAAPTP